MAEKLAQHLNLLYRQQVVGRCIDDCGQELDSFRPNSSVLGIDILPERLDYSDQCGLLGLEFCGNVSAS